MQFVTRKVRAGWYTIAVIDFIEVLEKRATTEFYIDVWSEGTGKNRNWIVSYRTDMHLDVGLARKIAYFTSSSAAKNFACAIAKALVLKYDTIVDPTKFDEYAFLAYRFEVDNSEWCYLIDKIGGK